MRRLFQFLSLAVMAAALMLWVNTGANRGWTKTSVETKFVDEVTGIEAHQYQKRFVPGVDFLGVAFAGALVLAGVSFFVNNRKQPKLNP